MGEDEIDGMSGAQDIRHQLSDAERKRRKLEEDMRKEAEDRRQKRKEMLMRETDIEEVCHSITCVQLFHLMNNSLSIYTDANHSLTVSSFPFIICSLLGNT